MLSNVTWTEYLAAVGVLLTAYYLFLAYRYRTDLKNFISGRLNRDVVRNIPEDFLNEDTQDHSSIDELEAVVQDLRYAILERAGKTAGKEELLDMFRQRLASYSGLRRPAYRVAINNYLMEHTKDICGVALSEEELEETWSALLR